MMEWAWDEPFLEWGVRLAKPEPAAALEALVDNGVLP